jgi:hypothetical protein
MKDLTTRFEVSASNFSRLFWIYPKTLIGTSSVTNKGTPKMTVKFWQRHPT